MLYTLFWVNFDQLESEIFRGIYAEYFWREKQKNDRHMFVYNVIIFTLAIRMTVGQNECQLPHLQTSMNDNKTLHGWIDCIFFFCAQHGRLPEFRVANV